MSIKKTECTYCKTNFSYNDKQKFGKWCSNKCQMQAQYEEYIKMWKAGEENGGNGYEISRHIRRFLHETYDSKCSVCGWGSINISTNKVPLEIHHIDGDSTNHSEKNLSLLCPNCHSLTENFGSRNKLGRYKRVNKQHPKFTQ
jgi:hypothetical protein